MSVDLGFVKDRDRLTRTIFALLQDGEETDWLGFDADNLMAKRVNGSCTIRMHKIYDVVEDYEDEDDEDGFTLGFSIYANCFPVVKTPHSYKIKDASTLVAEVCTDLLVQFEGYANVRKLVLCDCKNVFLRTGEVAKCKRCVEESTHYDQEVCPICIDADKHTEVWCRPTQCEHAFHRNCLAKVIENGKIICPLCRGEGEGWIIL